jgi:hypothetical protein
VLLHNKVRDQLVAIHTPALAAEQKQNVRPKVWIPPGTTQFQPAYEKFPEFLLKIFLTPRKINAKNMKNII